MARYLFFALPFALLIPLSSPAADEGEDEKLVAFFREHLKQEFAVLAAIVVGGDDPAEPGLGVAVGAVRPPMWRRVRVDAVDMFFEPTHRLGAAALLLAADQIEHATAGTMFVVVEGAGLNVDRQAAMVAVAPFAA